MAPHSILENIDFKVIKKILRESESYSDAAEKLTKLTGSKITKDMVQKYVGYRTGRISHTGTVKKTKPIFSGSVASPDSKRTRAKGNRFVITAAQNNTEVFKPFFRTLETFCSHNNAQLIISRVTYNKSGFQNLTTESDGLWYDRAVVPYLKDEAIILADDLIFCGELDILPTAVDPLSGFENYTEGRSGIIPHTKLHMKSLPRMKGEHARFLYTTGCVTQRNYIQRKAGQKAEFHHIYGALYVEVDNSGDWWVRQLVADSTGAFYDLDSHYAGRTVKTGQPVEAINWGDIHVEKADYKVSKASWFADDSMLKTLLPRHQFVHDLTDFSARNHHNINDPYFWAKKHHAKQDSVRAGIEASAHFLEGLAKYGTVLVVASNHHDALTRWLRDGSVHRDPVNASYWHFLNWQTYYNIEQGNDPNIYAFAIKSEFTSRQPNVGFLHEDESYVICGTKDKKGIECGIHGHLGADGAKGTPRGFRKIGTRVNTGHTHSAGIIDGVYTAGVSASLDMGYNRGVSSWSPSHIVTYKNGKRAIITIRNGKWRSTNV